MSEVETKPVSACWVSLTQDGHEDLDTFDKAYSKRFWPSTPEDTSGTEGNSRVYQAKDGRKFYERFWKPFLV